MMSGVRELLTRRRSTVLALVGAILVAVVAIVALLWLLGRGADSDNQAADLQTMLEGRPVGEGIAAAGGTCEASGAIDRRNCSVQGVDFQLAEGTWTRQAGERERECNLGQASRTTKVLTNRSWMVYADGPEELEKLQEIFAGNGVASQIVGYCDWNE